jgi:lipopolysaccharide export system protein LptA
MRRRGVTAIALVAALAVGLPAAGERPARDTLGNAGSPEVKGEPITVDADLMERFGREGLVVFSGNVIARQGASVQYADRMEVYLDESGNRIVRTVSTGAVRVVTRDCRTGTAKRAEYFDLEQRLVLSGGARVWQDDNVVSGETITIFLSQDRSVVQGGSRDRVKAVFHPQTVKTADGKAAEAGATREARAAAPPCVN